MPGRRRPGFAAGRGASKKDSQYSLNAIHWAGYYWDDACVEQDSDGSVSLPVRRPSGSGSDLSALTEPETLGDGEWPREGSAIMMPRGSVSSSWQSRCLSSWPHAADRHGGPFSLLLSPGSGRLRMYASDTRAGPGGGRGRIH